MIYTVLRQHYGDRMYFEGNTRELEESLAKPLMHAGILTRPDESLLLEAPENKDRQGAPNTSGRRKKT